MLLQCPLCGAKIRVTDTPGEQKVRYLCQECNQIVVFDLSSDPIPSTSSADRPKSHRAVRVLVVDDSPSFAKMAGDLLEKAGYQVSIAYDGVEALRKIVDDRPDAVLLDLFMPRMTGFEVLRTLRTSPGYKHFRNLPVLVTSGVYHPAEIEIVSDLRASGFINKENIQKSLVYRMQKILSSSPHAL